MNMAGQQAGTAFKALWRRAPLWQLCVMLALLGTLLCLLMPIEHAHGPAQTLAKLSDDGNYAAPSPHALATPAVQTMAHRPSPAIGVNTFEHPVPPPLHPVQTASLSLATASRDDGMDDAMAGRRFKQSIRINGFDIELPEGEWVVLANQGMKLPHASGVAYFLARVGHKNLEGVVRVFAVRSQDPSTGELIPVKGCQIVEANTAQVTLDDEVTDANHGCWSMLNYFTPPWQQWADRSNSIAPLDRAAAGNMTAKGISYPQDFVSVKFARSETWGLLDVSYLFSPDKEGLKSTAVLSYRDSDWYMRNKRRTPEQSAYLDKIRRWSGAHWGLFKQHFRDAR